MAAPIAPIRAVARSKPNPSSGLMGIPDFVAQSLCRYNAVRSFAQVSWHRRVARRVIWMIELLAVEVTESKRKKRSAFAALAFLVMGIPPFVNSLDNPRLAGLGGPDILQLIAIGLCIGGTLSMFLVGFIGGRRSS